VLLILFIIIGNYMVNFLRSILAFICLNWLIFSAATQANDLFLERLSVNDGLSQATIHDIYQDNEGFIWIATDVGLNLYDGNRFRVLPGANGNLTDKRIYQIRQDKQGVMWLLSENGVFSYNKKTDEYQQILPKAINYKDDVIHDFIFSKANDIWLISTKYLFHYNQQNQEYQKVVDLSAELGNGNPILDLIAHQHYIYLATRVGVFVVNSNTGQWKKLPSINKNSLLNDVELDKIHNLYISNEKKLYLGTYAGLYTADMVSIERFLADDNASVEYKLLDKSIASWVFSPSKESLYIGSQLGLSSVDFITDKIEHLIAYNDVFDDISNNIVSALIIDKQGVFWMGSNVTGIYKWDPKLNIVHNLSYKKSDENRLSDNNVWAIAKSKSLASKLWVATENGLNLVDVKTGINKRFLINKENMNLYTASYIHKIQEDNQQRLWLSTAKGMRLFDVVTKTLIDFPYSEKVTKRLSDEHYSIYIDNNNYFWGLTANDLWRMNIETGEIDDLNELQSLNTNHGILQILGFLPNSDEMLFSSNAALLSFNTKSKEQRVLYQHNNVLDGDLSMIDSWVIDNQNTLWLAFSTKGLVGLDATTFQQKYLFNKKNAQIDNNIYGLLTDGDGDLWFSSHNGIYHFNRKTQHFRNFNLADGFAAREFNALAYQKVNDSLMAYGSINGISLFDPLQLKAKNYHGELTVHATNVDILSREIKLPFILADTETIQLNYDDIGIHFEFSALSYQYKNLMYSIELQGESTVKYPDTKDNFITFTSLASGKHVLSVRVRSPNTGEYSPPTLLNISVSYPPWASPIAIVAYTLIFIMLLSLWLRKKQKQTKQLIAAHREAKYSERRLSLALHGSNSAVWDWQGHNNMLFGRRAANELGFKNLTECYSFEQHIDLIHENDREAFVHQWQTFVDTADIDDNFSCSYRLRTSEGDWFWYKDVGKIVSKDKQGKPNRITGSYTNITQSRVESERAQYYGEAFQQAQDWVLIIRDNFTRVMVNNSLKNAFGWDEEEFSFDAKIFGLDAKRMLFYKSLFKSLNNGDHWRGEELIETKSGEEHHVLINVNVSMNKTTNSLHYVCILTDITAQKVAEKELRYLANYDHLTDLPNRSLLLERIKHGIDYSRRIEKSIALFFIDLDRFKQINDSLGHDQGDVLLQEITKRLKTVLRVDDTIARLGGDEFVILLESFRSNSHLGKVAQKVIDVVGKPVDLSGNIVSVGASIGIALYPEDATNSDELLKNADVAMYHAKQIGRNTFQFFTPRMNVEASQRLNTESKIKQAHQNDEFINYYQPIVDSRTGKALGVELLMRWQSEGKLIMPGQFIDVSEEIGLIIPMTERALERAFKDLQSWRAHREEIYLSVNITAKHFAQENLVEYLTDILQRYDIPPHLLKLEVTESTLIKEPEKVIERMTLLAKLGVSLALDDFGTGYSSLYHLKQLPLNVLKIDRSFVSGIGIDSADEAIVDATLVLANSLCMNCIAEGVETKEQLAYLSARTCYAIQGYFYSKPVAADAIAQFVIDDRTELTI